MSFGLKNCYFVSINVSITAMLKDSSLDRLFLPTFLSLFRSTPSRLLADTAYNIFDVCLNLNVEPIVKILSPQKTDFEGHLGSPQSSVSRNFARLREQIPYGDFDGRAQQKVGT